LREWGKSDGQEKKKGAFARNQKKKKKVPRKSKRGRVPVPHQKSGAAGGGGAANEIDKVEAERPTGLQRVETSGDREKERHKGGEGGAGPDSP